MSSQCRNVRFLPTGFAQSCLLHEEPDLDAQQVKWGFFLHGTGVISPTRVLTARMEHELAEEIMDRHRNARGDQQD
jgi:hypothetical protein